MYRNSQQNKLSRLMQTNRSVFSTTDLAVLWNISNDNTLWTTIKRYVQKGNLIPVTKGIYATKDLNKINEFEIGCKVMGPFSYVSLDSVLVQEGVIFQYIYKATFVGMTTKKLTIKGKDYICRKMSTTGLMDREGIVDGELFSIATKERAIRDMKYYNSKYFFDKES